MSDVTITANEDDGSFLFYVSAEDTEKWETGILIWDIKYSFGDIVDQTGIIEIDVKEGATE